MPCSEKQCSSEGVKVGSYKTVVGYLRMLECYCRSLTYFTKKTILFNVFVKIIDQRTLICLHLSKCKIQ